MDRRNVHAHAMIAGGRRMYPKTHRLVLMHMSLELLLYGRQVTPEQLRELIMRGVEWEDAEHAGAGGSVGHDRGEGGRA